MRIVFLMAACAGLVAARGSGAQSSAEPAIIPRPVSLVRRTGTFRLTARTAIWADRGDSAVAERFGRSLAGATGFAFHVRVGAPPETKGASRIVFQRAAKRDTTLGAEGYRLEVRPGLVRITSSAPAGAFYATQTIRQLLPADVLRSAPIPGVEWTMPAVSIVDYPRFGWRGMHLDVARHFMPKEFVKKYVDLLAMHKMNRFHWHLTDDQGWRLEIKKYPRLTEIGAWRDSTIVGRQFRDTTQAAFDHKRSGGFYTQDDVREIVAYAAERFVTVVPEIEMPGHSQAAIAAYPMLGNFGDTIKPWTMWGVSKYILNPSDTTIHFMEDVLTEVMALFPGPYIHTGGDEAPKDQWKASPRAQDRMHALGLTDENALQSWFTTQIATFLEAHGRRLVGWDEILEGGDLPTSAVVMSWRGTAGGLTAARAGHDVVMTPGDYTYFDHYQSRNVAAEPLAIGGFLPLDSVYAYEPIPTGLEPQFVSHILGSQGQVWTEYIPDPKAVEYMAFPREAALAEVLWTPEKRRNYGDFRERLAGELERLSALDVAYRRPGRDAADSAPGR